MIDLNSDDRSPGPKFYCYFKNEGGGLIDIINLLHVPVQHPCYNFTKVMAITFFTPTYGIKFRNIPLPSRDVQLVHLK